VVPRPELAQYLFILLQFYNEELAVTAQAWADTCKYGRSGHAGIGENVFYSNGLYSTH
jgi:hypothetical protein